MTEPASIRYKNPGAMWGGNAISKKWGEQGNVALNDGTGQGNKIAVFPTYVAGICAQLDLWRSSKHYKNKRFEDAIRTWSGGNHVESYIAFVKARVPGITRDTIMDDEFWRGPMCIPFLKAQAWHEAGKPYPAPEADWIEARRRVLGGTPVAKPATSATVATGSVIIAGTVAKKPAEQGGGIDWSLAIPIVVVGLSIAAVAWFVWPKRKD